MKYVTVRWRHTFKEEPILIYSEINDAGMESRKVEVFADGRCGCTNTESACGPTELSYVPYPDPKKIAADPQFEPQESTAEELEEVWRRCQQRQDWGPGA